MLKAEAKDAAKPDAAKLQKARDKVEAALVKAVAKAAKKGVLSTLTAQELLDATHDLVDSVLDLSYGN